VDPLYDYKNRSEIKTTLKKASSNAYFYVEDDYYYNLSYGSKLEFDSYLDSLAENFSDVIYPKIVETFGSEWDPGIDNDSRITIILTKTEGNVGGYFNPNDEYKKEEIIDGKSNEREMVYLNVAFINDERIKSFLAHEFQHMITWYHKTKLKEAVDDIWLNEARSEYASTAIGCDDNYSTSNLRARVENFNPSDSLAEWQNKIYDYSSSNLFAQYLADNFGKKIFKAMIENDRTGIESINKAFESLGYGGIDFRAVFTDWTVANYLNDRTGIDDKYGYKNANLSYYNFHVDPNNSYVINDPSITISLKTTIKDWSSRYYEFKAGDYYQKNDIMEIDFDGENVGTFFVSCVVFHSDGTKEVNKLSLDNNQDSKFYISNFGKDVSRVVVIPSSQKQDFGFGNDISSHSFSISAGMTDSKRHADGSLLRSAGNSQVYLIENGKKRWITTVLAFVSNGYKWENINQVSDEELNSYPNGENILALNLKPDGSLIKGSGFQVYLIENGKKRWIVTARVFTLKGYKWDKIVAVSDDELRFYLEGKNIE